MKNAKYIVLGLLVGLAFSPAHADITFDGKQKLYFNAGTSWISYWNTSGAIFSAYFYNGSTNAFAGAAEQIDGNIYAVTVPAGTWSNVILTRHEPSTTIFDFDGSHGFWNQSRTISLNQYNWDNYISDFKEKDDSSYPDCEWNKLYSEQPRNGVTPDALAAYWGLTTDHISVCSNATGHPFTLTPNTYETGGGKYIYNYDMRAHAWFKTTDNGATWTNVDGLAGVRASADEGEMNWNNEKVGSKGSVTYYYLFAKEANDQRLIEVTVDKDCEVSCEITSFEVTPTAVNVGDNTYTMDGIVAFTKAEGDLIIECDGKSVIITSPESPQTFSLPGLTADGKAEDFRAYFSSMGSCEMHNNTTAPSPTTDATIHPQTDIAPKESTTLTPNASGTDPWEWTLQGDPTILKNTGKNTLDVPVTTIDHDEELTYIYTEYNPLPTLPTNLMDNGSFEDVSVPFKWHTGYKNSNVLNSNQIWDGATSDKMNIYDQTLEDTSDPSLKDGDGHYYVFKNKYGFFGVTNNANTYWRLMSPVAPRDGSYLAVIDGDEVADKQAWYASTADNPNLKLMRGTTYLFSFWVANINNFGELVNNGRRNCGKLQFHIRCHSVEDDTWYETDLGDPIDLNEDKYMDFNWHQNSSTFSTRAYFGKDFNADDVTISVVDKNNIGLTIGNDFALDDIQFKAVSVLSKSIKAREFFKVKIFETPTTVNQPVITIAQTPACGNTDFTMQVEVSYSTLNNKFPVTLQLTDNIYGDILPYPLPIDPMTNPNSVSLTLSTADYAKLVADGAEHTLTAKIIRLDGASVDKGGQNSTTYIAPGVPTVKTPVLEEQNKACDKTTFDLQVVTEYLAFKGNKLHYDWDGAEWTNVENPSLSYKESTWQTATGKLQNLVADGKEHTLRVYSDNSLDCEYTLATVTAPYMPSVTVNEPEVQPYACGENEYKVTVAVDFAYGQGHDLVIEDWNGNKETLTTLAADTHKEHTFTYAWETPAEHTYKVYFTGAEDCADNHQPAFTAPREPKIENIAYSVTPAACDGATYALEVTFDYYNQDGTLSVDVDGTAATAITPLVANSADKQSATATFTALPADGGTHTITVKTTGGAHNCSGTKELTGVPHLPVINAVTPVIATDYACGDAQYSVTLTVNYTNALGKNIIVKEGTSVLKTVTADTGAGTFSGDITLSFDFGTNHALKVCFENREDCAEDVAVTSPAQPALTVTPKVIPVTCETSYELDVEVKYTNQDGTLSVDVDGVAADPATLTFVPNSATEQTLTAKVTGLPADGKTHVLNVAFTGGTHSCAASPMNITAPLTGAITSVSVGSVPESILCDQISYTVPVTVAMPFDQVIGKNLFIAHEGVSEVVAITANPMTADIVMTTADATGLTMDAYIEGASVCKVASDAFNAPVRLTCDKDAATVCAGESYTWTKTSITYGPFATAGIDTIVNKKDSLFVTVLPLPEITLNPVGTVYEDEAEIRLPYTVTGGTPNLFNVTINSVVSSHRRTDEDAIVITRPASVTAGDYTVTVDVLDTLTGCQSSTNIVVTVIERPVAPAIAIKNVVPSVPADCEKTLSVTFDVDYTNLPVAFTYWLDSDKAAEQTATVVTGDKNARTVTGLTIGNIPADGKEHKIHVQFADTDDGKDSASFTAPLTHAIDAVTVSGVPASVLCNELPYTIFVAVTLPYDTAGIKLVLQFEGRDTAVYTGANPTTFVLPMRTTNTTGLSVTARYCDAPACPVTSNSFDAPARVGCVKDYADICEGESYTWPHNGVTYSPETLGEHKYIDDYDSLFLTVRAQPAVNIYPSGRVCDEESEIRWAYAVTQGTPDVFSVRIDGIDYALTATDGELVLTMPDGLQPGDYTATFTVGDAAISCTSTAQAEMTIAAGNMIYSKWSDLLFIDNAGKQYTAYQWYENGNILIDETRQYLYRTGGLPNEYFCRLTTTDGRTVYTCETTFDNAVPSRTVTSEGGEASSVKMYDPAGRLVSGKPSNGIYIILEEAGDEKIVRKVAVFE